MFIYLSVETIVWSEEMTQEDNGEQRQNMFTQFISKHIISQTILRTNLNFKCQHYLDSVRFITLVKKVSNSS